MGLILTIVIGGIVGWLASIVMKTNAQMGIIANVIVGIVGAWLGGYIAVAAGIGGGQIVHLFISLVGACILIFILKVLNIFK